MLIIPIFFSGEQEAKFMDEIDGIGIVNSPRREEIQELCQRVCGWEAYVFAYFKFHAKLLNYMIITPNIYSCGKRIIL